LKAQEGAWQFGRLDPLQYQLGSKKGDQRVHGMTPKKAEKIGKQFNKEG